MRSRLVLLTVAVTAMVVVAFSLPLALLVRDLAADRAVTDAEREGNALARTLTVVGLVDDATIEALVLGVGDDLELAVVTADGAVIGDSFELSAAAVESFEGRSLLVEENGGVAAYTPVVGLQQPTSIRSWVGPSRLRRNAAVSWTVIVALGFLLIGLAALLADRLGRTLVHPVKALASAAELMAQGDLEVAVDPAGPAELVAVGRAFNRLASGMRRLLVAERESVADISHRLRTPLTALRLNAEALERSEIVMADIERVEMTVDAIIEDARRPIRDAVEQPADLVEAVVARVSFWEPLAIDQQRELVVEVPGAAVLVAATDQDVVSVVDALFENAVAHTAEGSSLSVEVFVDGRLVVADRGLGFVDQGLVSRGVSGAGGTGLGLDIVRRTAEASGGSLAIRSRQGGGSLITVTFGLAAGEAVDRG